MATWTQSTLAARILESLGVVGENQSPTGEQTNRTNEIIDSVYKRLKPRNLVPFALTAIPEWAQQPLVKICAADVAPRYGYGGARLAERVQLASIGMRELAEGTAAQDVQAPVKIRYF